MRARFLAALLLLPLMAAATAHAQVATETVRRFTQTYLQYGVGSIDVKVNASASVQGGVLPKWLHGSSVT